MYCNDSHLLYYSFNTEVHCCKLREKFQLWPVVAYCTSLLPYGSPVPTPTNTSQWPPSCCIFSLLQETPSSCRRQSTQRPRCVLSMKTTSDPHPPSNLARPCDHRATPTASSPANRLPRWAWLGGGQLLTLCDPAACPPLEFYMHLIGITVQV